MLLHPAFYVLTATVLLGLYLSLHYLGLVARRSWLLSLAHGGLAAAGLGLLFASLGGAPRGEDYGVQSFGVIAACIALVAIFIALIFLAIWMLANKRMTWLIGLHATVALMAYCFLLAFMVF
jgi:hypothetical protein